MVQCELCGKVVRTTQGLRGHKTFIHGLHGNRAKQTVALAHNQAVDETSGPVESENNSTSGYRDRLDKLINEVVSNTELLMEVRRKVHALQNQLTLMATSTDVNRIATKVELIGKSVEKHEQWFNPQNIDEIILGLGGGPIAFLEKRLDLIQPIKLRRRKNSDVKYRG